MARKRKSGTRQKEAYSPDPEHVKSAVELLNTIPAYWSLPKLCRDWFPHYKLSGSAVTAYRYLEDTETGIPAMTDAEIYREQSRWRALRAWTECDAAYRALTEPVTEETMELLVASIAKDPKARHADRLTAVNTLAKIKGFIRSPKAAVSEEKDKGGTAEERLGSLLRGGVLHEGEEPVEMAGDKE